MISFPNAKINLGLNVIERRNDGFHNIETAMVPIPLCDSLEIIANKDGAQGTCELQVLGLAVEGNNSDNLCVQAYNLVGRQHSLPAVKIRLLKNIPMGAGLGGGSSDAAFTIKMLNKLFELDLSIDQMKSICTELGSDCSFFIENKPAFALGKGEILRVIELDLQRLHIVVVHPKLHINTGAAYAEIIPDSNKSGQLEKLVQQPVNAWKDTLKNAFEIPMFGQYPELDLIKKQLYKQGAVYASMTGSGSSVYGVFSQPQDLQREFGEHRVWSTEIT